MKPLNRIKKLTLFPVVSIMTAYASLASDPSVEMQPYGDVDGKPVFNYILTNTNGVVAEITNYGGIVTKLLVPDRNGKMEDVVLGYENLDKYVESNPYFGALIGRVGNRIANGKFELNGVEYELVLNNFPADVGCHLHGGTKGFDKVVWDAKPIFENNQPGLELHYFSPDGEEGYPGNLDVTVTYLLTDENELDIRYRATTDKSTPVNLTNHSYFNLRGEGKGDILEHFMMINADQYTPVNAGLIPTGELVDVEGTPFDFREPTMIGNRIESEHQQIEFGLGYDHNWVLNGEEGMFKLAARVYDAKSGRQMEVYTTEPGVQFYSGNFLDGSNIGKKGIPYEYRTGFCLETQHFPDSVNQPNFPSIILDPGEVYETRTVYRFSVR